MKLRGFSLWSKNCGLKEQAAAHEAHGVTTVYVCGQDDNKLETRESLIKSLRSGEGVAVLGLHCLATDKDDLRWALIGEDKETKYKGIFLRGAAVYIYALEAQVTDMPSIEATLTATEWWARERSKRSLADDVKYGSRGGRPQKKRMPARDAKPIWLGAGTEVQRLRKINRISRKLGHALYTKNAAYKYLGKTRVRLDPNTETEN